MQYVTHLSSFGLFSPGSYSCITIYSNFNVAAAETTGLTAAEAAGIATVLSSIVSFAAGLLVGLIFAHCYHSTRQQKVHSDSPSNGQQPVPMIAGGDIELEKNVAYRIVGM